jgi:hypothetical protein
LYSHFPTQVNLTSCKVSLAGANLKMAWKCMHPIGNKWSIHPGQQKYVGIITPFSFEVSSFLRHSNSAPTVASAAYARREIPAYVNLTCVKFHRARPLR